MNRTLIISKALEKRLIKIRHCTVAAKLLDISGDQISLDPEINFLSLGKTDSNKISYIQTKKLEQVGSFRRWHSKVRTIARPARTVAKLFNDFSPEELEDFNNNFLIVNEKEDAVKFFSGEKIRWGYLEDNYYESLNSLGTSCMRYSSCQQYLDLYCDNKEHVQLAVILKQGLVAARCIVWFPNSIKNKSVVYFDRIYGWNSEYELKLYSQLDALGYIFISNKNNIKLKERIGNTEIKLPYLNFDYYPYMDTFCHINDNGINNYGKGDELSSTDGERLIVEECACCGDSYEEENLNTIVTGELEGELVCNNCCEYVPSQHGYVPNDEIRYCNYSSEYYLIEDFVELYDGGQCYKDYSGLLTDIDGNYFTKYDTEFENIDGDWYKIGSDSYNEKIEENELSETEL